MSVLTAEFKFEIGDIVYFNTAPHYEDAFPLAFQVVERIAQQCPGGIQLHYRLGGVNDMQLEVLLSKTPPPYQLCSEEKLADIRRIADARRGSPVDWRSFVPNKESAGQ